MGGGTVWFAAAGGVRLSCTRDGETTGVPTGVGRRWKSPPTGGCSARGRRGGRQERSAAAGGAGRRRRGSVLKMPADGQHEWSTVLERGEGGKGRDASRGEARVLGLRETKPKWPTLQQATLQPCDPSVFPRGAPRGPWSLPSFVNEPPATLHLDRSRVDDGGRGVRPTSPRSSKDRSGSWFVMVIRAGPGLNTTRHNTRRPLLSLPWPCRPASRCLAISAKGWVSVCRGGCEGAI